MNKQRLNITYESPLVEVVEVEVEQGFSTSIGGGAFGDDDGIVITPPVS